MTKSWQTASRASAPNPLLLLLGQIASSFLAFSLTAGGLRGPLTALPRERALGLLFWVHAF